MTLMLPLGNIYTLDESRRLSEREISQYLQYIHVSFCQQTPTRQVLTVQT